MQGTVQLTNRQTANETKVEGPRSVLTGQDVSFRLQLSICTTISNRGRSHRISTHVASWYAIEPCLYYNQLHGNPKTPKTKILPRAGLFCDRPNPRYHRGSLRRLERVNHFLFAAASQARHCSPAVHLVMQSMSWRALNCGTSTRTPEIWSFFVTPQGPRSKIWRYEIQAWR